MSDNNDGKGLRKLSLYLLQEGMTPNDVLKEDCKKKLSSHPNEDPRIKILLGTKVGKVPEWKDAYGLDDEQAEKKLINASAYGLIFVQFNEKKKEDEEDALESSLEGSECQKWMVVTHGCGRDLIDLNKMEHQFGLRFTLNSVHDITLTNTKSVTTPSQHNLIDHHPKGASMNEFHMLELVKGIRGKEFEINEKNKKKVKISMEGYDMLKVNFWDDERVSVEELPDLCEEYYEKFKEETYKERYPSMKNFLPIYDKKITEQLDKKLIDSIQQRIKNQNSGDIDIVDLSYPWTETPIEFGNVKFRNFKKQVQNFKNQENVCELNIENYLDLVSKNKTEKGIFEKGNNREILKRLEKHKIHFTSLNEGKNKTSNDNKMNEKKWSVKKCLIFDTKLEENRYIFIDSSWYMVDLDYIETVTKNFEEKLSSSTLPPLTTSCSEGEYNKMACKETGYLLLDNISVYIGKDKKNEFEFCDILTKDSKMYHVKKYGPISSFGYVFKQAEISVDILHREKNVYDAVYNLVKDKGGDEFAHAIKTIKDIPRNATVCIAVIAKKSKQLLQMTIPCRISFYNTTKFIEKFGHNVVFEWIDDESPPKPKQQKILPYMQPSSSNAMNSESNINDSGISTITDSISLDSTTQTFSELHMSKGIPSLRMASSFDTKSNSDDEIPYKKKRSSETSIDKK